MDKRRSELFKLRSYIQRIDSEVTMILQSLQWDCKHLIEGLPMIPCKYDPDHTVPPDRLDVHEAVCRLRSAGYSADEQLLPDPADADAHTLVTLNKDDITNIIDYAAKIDPLFRRGRGPEQCQPMTLDRLQQACSADERRAIHDAVVSAVPSCHDLLELALSGAEGSRAAPAPGRSRAAVLAELRDTRRRRTKYRGAAKTRNYSDVLRDLVATQMEHFSEALSAASDTTNKETASSSQYEEVHIKKEPEEGLESRPYPRDQKSRQKNTRESRDKHKERDRERRRDDYKRDKHTGETDRYFSSSKERSRGRNDRASRDKYRRDDDGDSSLSRAREYRDSSRSSRGSDSRYTQERGERYEPRERAHRRDRYTKYYDSKDDDFGSTKKRIKREKD